MRRVVLGLVLVVAAAACSGGDDDGGPGATATRAPSSTTTTGTTVPGVTTSPPPTPTPLPTGEEAIDALLDRWRAGDPLGAARVATMEAVSALFLIPPETGEARGCNAGDANVNVSCVFRLEAGELQVRASPSPDGSGYLVDFVILGS